MNLKYVKIQGLEGKEINWYAESWTAAAISFIPVKIQLIHNSSYLGFGF